MRLSAQDWHDKVCELRRVASDEGPAPLKPCYPYNPDLAAEWTTQNDWTDCMGQTKQRLVCAVTCGGHTIHFGLNSALDLARWLKETTTRDVPRPRVPVEVRRESEIYLHGLRR